MLDGLDRWGHVRPLPSFPWSALVRVRAVLGCLSECQLGSQPPFARHPCDPRAPVRVFSPPVAEPLCVSMQLISPPVPPTLPPALHPSLPLAPPHLKLGPARISMQLAYRSSLGSRIHLQHTHKQQPPSQHAIYFPLPVAVPHAYLHAAGQHAAAARPPAERHVRQRVGLRGRCEDDVGHLWSHDARG